LKITLGLILALVLFVVSVNYGVFGHLFTEEELLNFENEKASIVLSEEGNLIGKFFAENRTNIKYNQIPSHLINALIATEDARYFEHKGVDSRSLLRVLFKTIILRDRSSGGGSTITQQLAKNMFGRKRFGPLTMLVNKSKEGILAHRLEKVYNKEEILTIYLNTIPFGENVYGIGSASRRFFNKKVELLTIQEGAVLVGMLKANTFYNPRLHPENAKKRRNVVFNQMERYEYLSSNEADSLSKLPLGINYANLESEGPANYFLVQVRKEAEEILREINLKKGKNWNLEKDGLIITTTLNLELQNYTLKAFKSQLGLMQKRLRKQYETSAGRKSLNQITSSELKKLNLTNRSKEVSKQNIFDWDGFYTDSISVTDSLKKAITLLHSGYLALDPKTGAIKVWVGGIDYRTQPYDQILAKRQLASSFKPILYTAALEKGRRPCDYLKNELLTLTDFEDWTPENYDHSTGGKYSMRGALIKSMNIPTVNLFFATEFESIEYLWQKMGFAYKLKNTPSLSLGTAEASVYELAVAYASFANGGFKIDPKCIISIKTIDGEVIYENKFDDKKVRIIDKRSSLLMSAMLQKAITSGTGLSMKSTYGVSIPLAGKTGTSQNYSDAWFACFNPNLVMVTRAGASSPSIHFNSGANGSGSRLALPLVAKTLRSLQQNPSLRKKYSQAFPELPNNLTSELNCLDYKEDNEIDKLIKLFKKDKSTTLEKEQNKAKKKPFLKRIFGK